MSEPPVRSIIDGFAQCRALSDRTDRLVMSLSDGLPERERSGWCMMAVGGYGRRELCPHSDIDILLLTGRRTSRDHVEKTVKMFLYPLWDRGFTVGYSIRTVREAVRDTRDDFFFRTSLLDARHLCGSRELSDELVRSCAGDRHLKDAPTFLRNLDAHIKKRHERCGDASYILEPDIKDGTGSLRDYHCLKWIMQVAAADASRRTAPFTLSEADHRELEDAAGVLLGIRYALHDLTGRKTDRLCFEYQTPLAEKLGFRGCAGESAAELLMRTFHCSALSVKSITGSARRQLAADFGLCRSSGARSVGADFRISCGLISHVRPGDVPRMPVLLMDLFALMAETGASLSSSARDMVRRHLDLVTGARLEIGFRKGFIRVLMGRHCIEALTSMLETGMLERFMPEFASVKGRTQVDIYHTWTVDLHSIRTVHEISLLAREDPETCALVKDREILHLAALLHDIGKGYGRPHAVMGASVAGDIARRLGFSDERADLAAFLVHHHLLMPDIAYRRDLSEEKASLDCARIARNEHALAMLYLLSVADSRATGPLAWDDWKSTLLKELFTKALHSLQRGILRDPQTMMILEERWSGLIRDMPAESGPRGGGRLWVLPQAYVIHTDVGQIKRHLALSSGIAGPEDIRMDVHDRGDYARVTILAQDRPGLFAMLAGIFTMSHLAILSAQVFTWLDGIAADTFHVLPPWEGYAQWDRIGEHFRAACTGRLDVGMGVAATKPLKTRTVVPSPSKPRVTLDNGFSDFFTLIEVRSPWKQGMLYLVARAITTLGLDIHRAFLSHTGDPCTDVFYVVDGFGEKMMDPPTIDGIVRGIEEALH